MPEFDLEALEAEALAMEAAAKAVELTEEEKKRAALAERIVRAREERAKAEQQRREPIRVAKEAAARKAAGGSYLVRGLDLVSYFPAEVEPPPLDQLPGGGVIVIRSPLSDALDKANAEFEHKTRPIADTLIDLLCDSVVDPDISSEGAQVAGIRFRAFCEAYKGAATLAGDEVLKLGGQRARATKRGSA